MNPIVRNVLAVIVGWIVGSAISISLVYLVPYVISPDIATLDGLEFSIPNTNKFVFLNFTFPLLAYAAGALVGAFVAAKIGATRKMMLAFIVGIIFLIIGTTMVGMISVPTCFIKLDLISLPMALFGGSLAGAQKTFA